VAHSAARAAAPPSVASPRAPALVLLSTIAVAVLDGSFAIALYVASGSTTLVRLFQGIASVLIGPSAFRGGTPSFALGIALHCTIALTWSVIFLLLLRGTRVVPRMLESPFGALKVAVLYGPLVYLAMSLALVPLFTHRMPPINQTWALILVGHIPFVGLPIAMIVGRAARHWNH
jgi:hypothetical protein